jgi:hypothetical protein
VTTDRPAPEPGQWPLGIRADAITAMLNFEIVDHPEYDGLEIQYFDDTAHGHGILVLLGRSTDGKTDVYRQAGLTVDPAGFNIKSGLGEWAETEIEPAVLVVAPDGVQADVRFRDAAGRLIEVRVNDRDGRARRPAALLAPFGSAIERPTALLLVWMRRFDLVRAAGTAPVIRIDGRPVTIGRLPGARLHRRHLIKYAADLLAVEVNPDRGAQPAAAGSGSLVAMVPGEDRPCARLTFEPPVPGPGAVPTEHPVRGSWAVGIADAPAVTGGRWTAQRTGDAVELALEVTRPWRPRRLPPLMRLVTRVAPLFRRWPTTYRWTARWRPADPAMLTAGWDRVGSQGDSAYRRRISR